MFARMLWTEASKAKRLTPRGDAQRVQVGAIRQKSLGNFGHLTLLTPCSVCKATAGCHCHRWHTSFEQTTHQIAGFSFVFAADRVTWTSLFVRFRVSDLWSLGNSTRLFVQPSHRFSPSNAFDSHPAWPCTEPATQHSSTHPLNHPLLHGPSARLLSNARPPTWPLHLSVSVCTLTLSAIVGPQRCAMCPSCPAAAC
jgi:hypothetical protein